MESLKLEKLSFKAPSGEIKASLLSVNEVAREIAVVLPGAGYSSVMPLLYYSIRALLQKGYQVLAIEKIYTEDNVWSAFKDRELALRYVEADSLELLSQIGKKFSGRVQILLGRSLGTFQLACALEHRLLRPQQIVWQCPSLVDKWSIMKSCTISGFGIIGTMDQRYETAISHLPIDRLVIDGADHSLEIPDRPIQSVQVLEKVIQATHDWVSKPNSSKIKI